MKNEYQAVRDKIIANAITVLDERGTLGLGLSEVMNAAGVPKGSFYHYFPSKDDFQTSLIAIYADNFVADACRDFAGSGSAYDRIERFLIRWLELQGTAASTAPSTTLGTTMCPLVRLAFETNDLSDRSLRAVRDAESRLLEALAGCIALGQSDGSLGTTENAGDIAASIYYLWIGASIAGCKQRNGDALLRAHRQTELLLRPVR